MRGLSAAVTLVNEEAPVVRYLNSAVVSAPLGVTVPARSAVVAPTLDGSSVVAVGAPLAPVVKVI